jgi:hypothetical protein
MTHILTWRISIINHNDNDSLARIQHDLHRFIRFDDWVLKCSDGVVSVVFWQLGMYHQFIAMFCFSITMLTYFYQNHQLSTRYHNKMEDFNFPHLVCNMQTAPGYEFIFQNSYVTPGFSASSESLRYSSRSYHFVISIIGFVGGFPILQKKIILSTEKAGF